MVYAADIHVLSVFVNSFFILSFVLFFLFFVFCFSGEGGGGGDRRQGWHKRGEFRIKTKMTIPSLICEIGFGGISDRKGRKNIPDRLVRQSQILQTLH